MDSFDNCAMLENELWHANEHYVSLILRALDVSVPRFGAEVAADFLGTAKNASRIEHQEDVSPTMEQKEGNK